MKSLLLIAFIYITAIQANIIKRDSSRDYYTLHFPQGKQDDSTHQAAKAIAHQLNTRYEGQVGELKTYFVVSQTKKSTIKNNKRAIHNQDDDQVVQLFDTFKKRSLTKRSINDEWSKVETIKKQVLKKRTRRAVIPRAPILTSGKMILEDAQKTLKIADPGFSRQWHLVNLDDFGNDINITSVWKEGITGNGTTVAILDDGLDYQSRDLADNFFAEGSYDFNDHVDLPTPVLWNDYHGTRCAGQIAAVKNEACGVGIAYNSKVSGIRILSGEITDVDEAAALNYNYHENHIFSCSWGPPDDGRTMEAPTGMLADAFKNGIENGRHGKGSIYVFATGNGGDAGDNCNFDGYTNSIYTITVGALDHANRHPSYAERCSAQLVVTYSSGGGKSIYTTNHGNEECTDIHGGTSAAAPNAAGIFALVLSIRPDLTWRDMQHLCVQTALPVDLDDSDWKKLPSGRMYNHKYGYGKLDTWAIIQAAKKFKNVNKQTHLILPVNMTKTEIPDTSNGKHKRALKSAVQVTESMIKAAGLLRLEHITATVNIEHQRRGDIQIILESPSKVESELAAVRHGDASNQAIVDWKFMSVKHWEENPIGNWTLLIYDEHNPTTKGSLLNWTLTLFGELDPNFQGEPNYQPDVNHDTTNDTPTSALKSSATPTEIKTTESHSLRPTRVKPSSNATPTDNISSSTSSSTASTPITHLDDEADPNNNNKSSTDEENVSDNSNGNGSGIVYGFIGTVAILGIATGMYARKKKYWRSPGIPTQSSMQPSQGYEFEEFKNDDDDDDEVERGNNEDDDDGDRGSTDERPLLAHQEQ
ncbi:peptidase S8/S53 domain-containing protein [Cunninghamella echinulata]|nr:peptidase S8/S53 domain-containing protein [Cunninghamella echinulata]